MFFGVDTSSFMPHGHCILWSPQLLIPMVIAEALTIISYFLIPVGIFRFMQLRHDLNKQVKRILYLFIAFIFFCGLTHLVSTWNYWNSNYVLETFIKLITGIISFATLIIFYKNLKNILLIPSLDSYNKVLKELKELNSELEQKVEDRTKQLNYENEKANLVLKGVSDGIVLYYPIKNDAGEVVDFGVEVSNKRAASLLKLDPTITYKRLSLKDDLSFLNKTSHFDDCVNVLISGFEKTTDPIFAPDIKKFYRITISRSETSDLLFVFFADVTEREDIKLDFMSTSKLAAIGELAGGIAHEINTPLQINAGLLRQLKRKVSENAEALEIIEKIDTTKNRVRDTVINLKRLSHGDSAELSVIGKDKLKEITESFLRIRLDDKNFEYKVEEPSSDFKVEFVEISFSQILNNLISNALDSINEHNSEQRNIWVKISEKEAYIDLEFSDSGPGIKEENIDKIFDPLFSTKEVGKGTGLGLSISKRLAISMGGDLKYINAPRTSFVLSLKKVKS